MKTTNILSAASALLALPVLLTGCATSFNPTLTGVEPTAGVAVHGKLMGGQQPIVGAHIYLFTAGTTDYGSAATDILGTGTVNADGTDSVGPYIATDAAGGFDLTSKYSCSGGTNTPVYMVSSGGNPGLTAGTNNTAAVLMLALGTCGQLLNTSYITMNELTTAAAVTALQQFIGTTDFGAGAPQGDFTLIGAPGSNALGLRNAMNVAQQLVNINNGVPQGANSQTIFPQAKIFTLGNSLAGCVNATGPTNAGCPSLFSGAIDESHSTVQPTNTFQAMFNIARYPVSDSTHRDSVFNAQAAVAPYGQTGPYGAAPLTSTPPDYALPIVYVGGVLDYNHGSAATSIAIDGNGYAYVSVCGTSCDPTTDLPDSLTEIRIGAGPGSDFAGSGADFSGGNVHNTPSIAISNSNQVWTLNDTFAGSTDPNTHAVHPAITTPTIEIYTPGQDVFSQVNNTVAGGNYLSKPQGIAFDVTGLGLITDSGNDSIYETTTDGTITFPFGTISTLTTPITNPAGIAVDTVQTVNTFQVNRIVVADSGTFGSTTGGIAVFTPAGGSSYSEVYFPNATHPNGPANPTAVALDSTHGIWALDPYVNLMYHLNENGGAATTGGNTGYTIPGSTQTANFVLDGLGEVVIPACDDSLCGGSGVDTLAILNSTGDFISGRSGVTDSSLSQPVGVAVDASGNAWVANGGNGAVTVFVGMTAPVVTPLAHAVKINSVATRP